MLKFQTAAAGTSTVEDWSLLLLVGSRCHFCAAAALCCRLRLPMQTHAAASVPQPTSAASSLPQLTPVQEENIHLPVHATTAAARLGLYSCDRVRAPAPCPPCSIGASANPSAAAKAYSCCRLRAAAHISSHCIHRAAAHAGSRCSLRATAHLIYLLEIDFGQFVYIFCFLCIFSISI